MDAVESGQIEMFAGVQPKQPVVDAAQSELKR